MLDTLFIILVVVGFILWFLATFPTPPYTERAARACFALAAIIWAVGAWRH
jgi:hypothetical protein